MELLRRRHEEARDPAVEQLNATTDTLKRQGETQEKILHQLQEVTQVLKSSTQHLATSQAELESRINQQLARYVLFIIVCGGISIFCFKFI